MSRRRAHRGNGVEPGSAPLLFLEVTMDRDVALLVVAIMVTLVLAVAVGYTLCQ
jgi:hypothetical protein